MILPFITQISYPVRHTDLLKQFRVCYAPDQPMIFCFL